MNAREIGRAVAELERRRRWGEARALVARVAPSPVGDARAAAAGLEPGDELHHTRAGEVLATVRYLGPERWLVTSPGDPVERGSASGAAYEAALRLGMSTRRRPDGWEFWGLERRERTDRRAA